VSGLANLVEDVESQGVAAVGSRVGKSLLGCFVLTPEKRACRLVERGLMNKFRGSLEGCRKAIRMYFY